MHEVLKDVTVEREQTKHVRTLNKTPHQKISIYLSILVYTNTNINHYKTVYTYYALLDFRVV
jgi:hypothetical protein